MASGNSKIFMAIRINNKDTKCHFHAFIVSFEENSCSSVFIINFGHRSVF